MKENSYKTKKPRKGINHIPKKPKQINQSYFIQDGTRTLNPLAEQKAGTPRRCVTKNPLLITAVFTMCHGGKLLGDSTHFARRFGICFVYIHYDFFLVRGLV